MVTNSRGASYDLACPGFLQVDKTWVLGGALTVAPMSERTEYELDILITYHKDDASDKGAWWLNVNDVWVGYWPEDIYTTMKQKATGVSWGGEIVRESSDIPTETSMGNGAFPEEGLPDAAFQRNLKFREAASGDWYHADSIVGRVTNPNCWDVGIEIEPKNERYSDWGTYFFVGGPGALNNEECINNNNK